MGSYEKGNQTRAQGQTVWRRVVASLSVMLLIVFGLNVYKYWPNAESPAANAVELQEVTLNTRPTPTSVAIEGPDSPHALSLTLTPGKLVVAGTAPNAEVAGFMSTFPTALYRNAVSADVGLGVPAIPEWLDSYQDVVRQLGTFSEAVLQVDQTEVRLQGVVHNERDLERMERLLSGERGFPPLNSSVEVSGLPTAEVDILPTSGQVIIDGVVPSQPIKDKLFESVRLAYDVEIIDTLTIDPGIAQQLNLLRFADDVTTLSTFENQRISFNLGQTYSFISRELNFAPGESDLTSESSDALAELPDFLNRTGLDVRIIGHTDDVGDQQVNTLLSIDRAKSVAGLLLEADVDSDQIIVIGLGERSSSDGAVTDEERAGDRSVDIQIGSVVY